MDYSQNSKYRKEESLMQSLIIWLSDGQTMKFEDVKNFKEVSTEDLDSLQFNYLGVSTGVRRNAVFIVPKIMGWALEEKS